MSFAPRVTNGKGLIDPARDAGDVGLTGGVRAGGLDAWMPRRDRIVLAKGGQASRASHRGPVTVRWHAAWHAAPPSLLTVRILGERRNDRGAGVHT